MKTLCGVFSSWKRAIRGIPGVIIGFSLLRLSWGEAAHLIFSLTTYLWLTVQSKLSQNETEIGCRLELFFKGQTKIIMQTPEVYFRRQNPGRWLQSCEWGMALPRAASSPQRGGMGQPWAMMSCLDCWGCAEPRMALETGREQACSSQAGTRGEYFYVFSCFCK